MGEIRRKYTGQVMHIASCIKVVQNAMSMTGKSQEQIDNILETFVGSFANNLDLQKIGKLFQIDESEYDDSTSIYKTRLNDINKGKTTTLKGFNDNYRKSKTRIKKVKNDISLDEIDDLLLDEISR